MYNKVLDVNKSLNAVSTFRLELNVFGIKKRLDDGKKWLINKENMIYL